VPKRTSDYHEFLLEQLTDPVFAANYLNEAHQDSRKMFLKALRNVAESRRMAVVALEVGVNRESLYKSLSEDGNPSLSTYDSVLSALGLDYFIKPKQQFVPSTSEPTPTIAATATNNKDVNDANSYEDKEKTDMAMASMTPAFVIAQITSSGFRQIQSAGGLE
jgi:probable addiction module antidote protein